MEKKDELRSIIEGCIRNERKPQEQLFKLYYGKLFYLALRYTSDEDTAQEILQDGFIKIFEKLNTFDFKGSFEGWIRKIIANTAIDSIRKSKKLPMLMEDDAGFREETEDLMEAEELNDLKKLKAETAMKAINMLSPAYRTVFNLYVMEDYTHKEIADLLGISEGTSKSNLAKAKANLQKILKEMFIKIES